MEFANYARTIKLYNILGAALDREEHIAPWLPGFRITDGVPDLSFAGSGAEVQLTIHRRSTDMFNGSGIAFDGDEHIAPWLPAVLLTDGVPDLSVRGEGREVQFASDARTVELHDIARAPL